MEKYYKINLKTKKDYLDKYIKSKKGYKKRFKISIVFMIIAACITFGIFLLMTIMCKDVKNAGIPIPVLALLTGLVFGLLPFLIGQSVMIKAKREYGYPYIDMTQEFLYTNKSGFQFGYHDTTENNPECMYVYQIPYSEITAVHFDETYNLITIIGAGEMIVYDDMSINRINYGKSQRKFYNNSPYSFILCIDEQKEFLQLLNKKMKEE